MTADKKRDAVSKYCATAPCEMCKLCNVWRYGEERCIKIDTATEEELDWALELIEGDV